MAGVEGAGSSKMSGEAAAQEPDVVAADEGVPGWPGQVVSRGSPEPEPVPEP
ncbi:hypothetical protein ACFQYP_05620 [Nonomuraea antimicrobica]